MISYESCKRTLHLPPFVQHCSESLLTCQYPHQGHSAPCLREPDRAQETPRRIPARIRQERPSVQRVYTVAAAQAPISAEELVVLTGLSRPTIIRACRRLEGLGLLTRLKAPARGRGHKAVFAIRSGSSGQTRARNRSRSGQNPENVNPHTPNIIKTTHSKDRDSPARSRGVSSLREGGEGTAPRRSTTDYQGVEAATVTLVLGARFYRAVMKAIRLGLEGWALPEPVRHALEGLLGNRVDGMSLAAARELVSRVWALRAEIERLAASGASPRRVCSFVAGRLAGVPERRSKREVLRRTAELIKNNHALLDARIAGLKRFEAEREREYRDGVACGRCGYTHSEIEYRSGYRDDGTGTLNCFGFARVKLQELREALYLLKRKEQRCTVCGGSLIGGNINGVCWTCHDTGRSDGQATLQELVALALKLNDAALAPSRGEITKLCTVCLRAQATAYGMCTRCRKLMVRSRYH